MRSGSLEGEILTRDRGRPLWGAAGLSLGVHLLLLYFLYTWTLAPSAPALTDARRSLSVTLTPRVEAVPERPAAETPEPEAVGEAVGEERRPPGDAGTGEQLASGDAPQTVAGQTESVAAPVSATPDPPAATTFADDSGGAPERMPADSARAPRPLDAAGVQAAILGFRSNYRSELIGEWSEDCLIYRRQHPGEDCPQQETVGAGLQTARETTGAMMRDVLRQDREAGRRLELRGESEKTFLALQRAGGVQRELLQDRYALLRERYDYMNGNYNNAAMNFVKTSQANNPNLGILVFNMMQFICDPMPCEYDETEFAVERPPEPERALPAFGLDSSLFDGGR